MNNTRIGLIVGTAGEYSRRVLRGVRRYCRESNHPWLFFLTSHQQPDLRSLEKWRPDGLIVHLTTRRLARQVVALGVPAVNVAFIIDDPPFPHVGNDDAGIARAAAAHLLDRFYRRFAFIGWPGVRFSDLREAGFSGAVREAGYDCVCYREPGRGAPRQRTGSPTHPERVRRWVAGLTPPVAVMACNDVRAWHVLQACQEVGRRVPEEVAVVGADNDEAWCLFADPPLSSVEAAAERIGQAAAAKLQRLLAGRRVEMHTAIGPLGVAARQSTDMLMVENPTVAEAVRFIRENSDRPIRIPDVLAAVAVSRRALERSFRQTLGRSPADEIRQAQLRRACVLLAGTDLSMAEVARRSGFTGSKRLSEVFRQQIGSTPTEYRKDAGRSGNF